jgi:hypothetical protein
MKPRLWASFTIFVSAYAPLALLFGVRDFDEQAKWFKHPSLVFGGLAFAVVSVVLLLWVFAKLQGQFTVRVTKLELRSNDLMNYSIPYVISFFSVDFGKWQDASAFGLFMALLFVLTLKTQSLFINPVLAVTGYGLFDVEFEESGKGKSGIFLTKLELKPGTTYRLERLSQFLFIATAKVEE